MSRIQHIGQDFTKNCIVNLLPGINLPHGVYQIQIQYITDTAGLVSMNHISMNLSGGTKKDLDMMIGQDVRSITFAIYRISYPTVPSVHFQYDLRIDRLILLNLAVKLLK